MEKALKSLHDPSPAVG